LRLLLPWTLIKLELRNERAPIAIILRHICAWTVLAHFLQSLTMYIARSFQFLITLLITLPIRKNNAYTWASKIVFSSCSIYRFGFLVSFSKLVIICSRATNLSSNNVLSSKTISKLVLVIIIKILPTLN